MEGACSNSMASKYLSNLPSRGLFSSTVLSSNPVLDTFFFELWCVSVYCTFNSILGDVSIEILYLSCIHITYLYMYYNFECSHDLHLDHMNEEAWSSISGGMRVYICDRDTSPPEEQIIKTNQANILIRSLTLKKQKSDSSSKDEKGKATTESFKGKRAAETVNGRASKRAMTYSSRSPRRGEASRTSEKDLQVQTVERLRALLKEKGEEELRNTSDATFLRICKRVFDPLNVGSHLGLSVDQYSSQLDD
ncbi:hypothetical protein HHK36_025162 [Tetracentron sinense]|uniref:DET1- and DDB1-associated protein 1 domain-containing protein n=1 Tax=Tetracentron sinense TaxID=13715 RepID=A0A834YM54_TETSI|nr:hypothetical protein HHK36_025162 [Tetracentron sinense]